MTYDCTLILLYLLLLIDIKEMTINLVYSMIKIVIMILHLSDASNLERAKKMLIK